MSVMIDGYVIDVAVSENHEFPSEVTQLPVESGADLTDHVRNRPVVVTLEGVVSDTPIGTVASLRAPGSLPSEEALAKLREIRARREPVTIVTSLGTYENMALLNLSAPRSSDTGEALRFTATFQQIELKTNERTTVRVEPPRAKKRLSRGSKQSKSETDSDVSPTPDKAKENASILYDLFK